MNAFAKIRSAIFACGLLSLFLSIALIVASYVRPVDTTDYFKQADEARPWITWGLDSAMIALPLCCFGRKWWRISTLALAAVVFVWWYFAAESLL